MVNRGSHGAIAGVRASREGVEKGGKGTERVKEDAAGICLDSREGSSSLTPECKGHWINTAESELE